LDRLNHEMPDLSAVKTKLDDKNPDYKPPTSMRRIESRKLNWKAESKLDTKNSEYIKMLGQSVEEGLDKKAKKIEHHKLDWKAEARTDTRNKTYTPPSKDVKKVVESHKLQWRAESKVKSRDNLHYREHSPTRSAGVAGRRSRSRSSTGARTRIATAPPQRTEVEEEKAVA